MKKFQENEFLKRLISRVLQEAEHKNFSSSTLASEFHMSLSTFHRKIKQHSGYTPSNFINYIKIRQACQILDSYDGNRIKIIDLAFELNFSDLPYFSRVFKKFTGLSPSNYRDLVCKNRFELNNPSKEDAINLQDHIIF